MGYLFSTANNAPSIFNQISSTRAVTLDKNESRTDISRQILQKLRQPTSVLNLLKHIATDPHNTYLNDPSKIVTGSLITDSETSNRATYIQALDKIGKEIVKTVNNPDKNTIDDRNKIENLLAILQHINSIISCAPENDELRELKSVWNNQPKRSYGIWTEKRPFIVHDGGSRDKPWTRWISLAKQVVENEQFNNKFTNNTSSPTAYDSDDEDPDSDDEDNLSTARDQSIHRPVQATTNQTPNRLAHKLPKTHNRLTKQLQILEKLARIHTDNQEDENLKSALLKYCNELQKDGEVNYKYFQPNVANTAMTEQIIELNKLTFKRKKENIDRKLNFILDPTKSPPKEISTINQIWNLVKNYFDVETINLTELTESINSLPKQSANYQELITATVNEANQIRQLTN